MRTLPLFSLLMATALLSACANRAPQHADAGTIVELPSDAEKVDFGLASGTYKCEFGMEVDVTRIDGGAERLFILWTGNQYLLERDPSASGLPRFEDRNSGLVWIDLPWKSVLLDGRTQKPLASECSHAAA
ncbi:MAG: hypothetical protein ACK4KV_24005 [Rhodocyclaceae bacterium]